MYLCSLILGFCIQTKIKNVSVHVNRGTVFVLKKSLLCYLEVESSETVCSYFSGTISSFCFPLLKFLGV